MRFALFAAFLNALYKAILCIMRRFCKDDKKNAFIAGFLSALSLAIDGFEAVCECSAQKYLELTYMCVPQQSGIC